VFINFKWLRCIFFHMLEIISRCSCSFSSIGNDSLSNFVQATNMNTRKLTCYNLCLGIILCFCWLNAKRRKPLFISKTVLFHLRSRRAYWMQTREHLIISRIIWKPFGTKTGVWRKVVGKWTNSTLVCSSVDKLEVRES